MLILVWSSVDTVRGAERAHLLLALVVWPLTTHLFRDGEPFLLLTEASPIFGRSLAVFFFFPPYIASNAFCLSCPLPGGYFFSLIVFILTKFPPLRRTYATALYL